MELFNPESGLIFWMLIVFGTVLFILGKYAWPVITSAIAKREAYIANAIRVADEANDRLERIKEERNEILAQAREEQNNMLKEVQQLKEKLIGDAKEQAAVEAKKLIDDARKAIIAEKEQALKDVRNQVAQLSVDIAGRVLRKNLANNNEQLELVNKMFDEVTTLN
ncbi:MAG: F0F1 ATP synthase subunit B [Prevotellaceae bacterium]|jgi:F-type H+-transporting ATPase subunit b|nr:F0F1 ATP synthase subunit B [Prevotellaceae bacterium]